jgi:RNA polymerase sigma factor for flagellar operon FliA
VDADVSSNAELHPEDDRVDTDRLITENLGLVYDLARKLTRAGGVSPEREDLISAGVQGLIQAASSFDPARGLAFSTLAVTRIRGSMLDEMRKWDHTPRSVRKKERELKYAEAQLWTSLGRRPTRAELAAELGVTEEEVHAWVLDLTRHTEESLDQAQASRLEDGRGLSVLDVVSDDAPDPSEIVDRSQSVDILQRCIRSLPEREARVLALYYFEELRLREIALLLEVTESRVSQIRHGALKKLRVMMQEQGVDR